MFCCHLWVSVSVCECLLFVCLGNWHLQSSILELCGRHSILIAVSYRNQSQKLPARCNQPLQQQATATAIATGNMRHIWLAELWNSLFSATKWKMCAKPMTDRSSSNRNSSSNNKANNGAANAHKSRVNCFLPTHTQSHTHWVFATRRES